MANASGVHPENPYSPVIALEGSGEPVVRSWVYLRRPRSSASFLRNNASRQTESKATYLAIIDEGVIRDYSCEDYKIRVPLIETIAFSTTSINIVYIGSICL